MSDLSDEQEPNKESAPVLSAKAQAEARIMAVKAERMEFELAVRRGATIPRDDAIATATAFVSNAKTKLLESCQTLAPRLAMEVDPSKVEEELRLLVIDFLQWLADGKWYEQSNSHS